MSTKQPNKAWLVTLLVTLALLSPIAVYVWTFGTDLSHDHSRWSEMGSAMSGIYTPILTLLTLAVLIAQVRLQARMNRHTFDETFVQESREQINFSLQKLVDELSHKLDNGSEIKTMLVGQFAYANVDTLAQPKVIEIAQALDRRHHRLLAFWAEYYTAMAGLRVHNYHPYSTALTATKQRAITMLSYEGCAALDNLVWCVSKGRLNYGFEFSRAGLPGRTAV